MTGKAFFGTPMKIKKKHTKRSLKWEEIMTKQQVIYWATNIFSKHYQLVAIDLSKKIELENPDLKQQIRFIVTFDRDGATMFFIIEK